MDLKTGDENCYRNFLFAFCPSSERHNLMNLWPQKATSIHICSYYQALHSCHRHFAFKQLLKRFFWCHNINKSNKNNKSEISHLKAFRSFLQHQQQVRASKTTNDCLECIFLHFLCLFNASLAPARLLVFVSPRRVVHLVPQLDCRSLFSDNAGETQPAPKV